MDEASIVSEVKSLRQLDGHIIDGFDVGAWHIDRKIQFLPLDVAKYVSSIVGLNH